MIKEGVVSVFGTSFNALTYERTLQIIDERLSSGKFTQHVVINVAKIVNMQSDARLKRAVEACDLINIDGMGVVWGTTLLGYSVPGRVTGIDLFYKLLALAQDRGYSVFLLGAKKPVIRSAVDRLRGMYPHLKIAGFYHGYFWDHEKEVVDLIKASKTDMLFVAISSPKKEQFIDQWKDELGVGFAMGVGGTFDIVAGYVKRAPLWMQNSGLEWFFRITQEPSRMWRRYLVTNSKFILMLLQEFLKKYGRK